MTDAPTMLDPLPVAVFNPTGAFGAPADVSPDVAALDSLKVDVLGDALGVAWQSFGRRTVVDAWHLARALQRVKQSQPGRQFAPYCERIGMSRSWSYKLLDLAAGSLAQVSGERTVEEAVKALKAPPEPGHVSTDRTDSGPPAAVPEVLPPAEPEPEPEDNPAAAVESVARESERAAILTEGEPAGGGLDFQKLYRKTLQEKRIETGRRQRAVLAKRKAVDYFSAVPRGEGDRAIDDWLAGHGRARKGAA